MEAESGSSNSEQQQHSEGSGGSEKISLSDLKAFIKLAVEDVMQVENAPPANLKETIKAAVAAGIAPLEEKVQALSVHMAGK